MMTDTIKQLTASCWVSQSSLFATNSGIFISEGKACLVDPGVFPLEIRSIAAFVQSQKAVPQTVILTHSHWDHIFGPEYLPGVKVVTQADYPSQTSGKAGAATLQQVEDFFREHQVERRQPFAIPQPDETFEQTMLLAVGGQSLRLVHAPGHRRDQLVVFDPGSALLWAADMLSDTDVPFVCESLLTYERTLQRIAALELELLIPGHGSPAVGAAAVAKRIADDRSYLQELHTRVERLVQEGRTAAEAVQSCASMPRRAGEENEGTHRSNVESAYLELGGQGDPASLGWGAIFPSSD